MCRERPSSMGPVFCATLSMSDHDGAEASVFVEFTNNPLILTCSETLQNLGNKRVFPVVSQHVEVASAPVGAPMGGWSLPVCAVMPLTASAEHHETWAVDHQPPVTLLSGAQGEVMKHNTS